MEENNKTNENIELNSQNVFKKAIFRICIIVLSTLILIFLINFKPQVNNEITKIYYIISIIGCIVSLGLFSLFFLKKISSKIKEKIFSYLDIFYIFVFTCALFQSIFAFGFFKASVDGTSMMPTFTPSQTLIVRTSNRNLDNFDVVVAAYDDDVNNPSHFLNNGDLLVKRIIAKGGDTFYFIDGVLYLNNKKIEEDYISEYMQTFSIEDSRFITSDGVIKDEKSGYYVVKEGYYFLMGDNRTVSNDSRQLGLFTEEQIVGKVIYELHGIFDWEKVK